MNFRPTTHCLVTSSFGYWAALIKRTETTLVTSQQNTGTMTLTRRTQQNFGCFHKVPCISGLWRKPCVCSCWTYYGNFCPHRFHRLLSCLFLHFRWLRQWQNDLLFSHCNDSNCCCLGPRRFKSTERCVQTVLSMLYRTLCTTKCKAGSTYTFSSALFADLCKFSQLLWSNFWHERYEAPLYTNFSFTNNLLHKYHSRGLGSVCAASEWQHSLVTNTLRIHLRETFPGSR